MTIIAAISYALIKQLFVTKASELMSTMRQLTAGVTAVACSVMASKSGSVIATPAG